MFIQVSSFFIVSSYDPRYSRTITAIHVPFMFAIHGLSLNHRQSYLCHAVERDLAWIGNASLSLRFIVSSPLPPNYSTISSLCPYLWTSMFPALLISMVVHPAEGKGASGGKGAAASAAVSPTGSLMEVHSDPRTEPLSLWRSNCFYKGVLFVFMKEQT